MLSSRREKIKHLAALFEQSNLDYRFAGSTAVNLLLEKEIENNRMDDQGREKDIDLLLIPSTASIDPALIEDIGMKSVDNPGGVDFIIGEHLRITDRQAWLQHKDCLVEIPLATLDPYTIDFDGQLVTTLLPMTLLHFYLIPGSLRAGDWSRALQLARWMKVQTNIGHSEEMYQSFHEFARKRREMYPIRALIWKMDRQRNILHKQSLVTDLKNIPGMERLLQSLRKKFLGC